MSYNDVKFIDITFPGGKVIQYPIFITRRLYLNSNQCDFLPTPEGVRLPLSLTCFCSVSGGSSPQSKGEYVYAGV